MIHVVFETSATPKCFEFWIIDWFLLSHLGLFFLVRKPLDPMGKIQHFLAFLLPAPVPSNMWFIDPSINRHLRAILSAKTIVWQCLAIFLPDISQQLFKMSQDFPTFSNIFQHFPLLPTFSPHFPTCSAPTISPQSFHCSAARSPTTQRPRPLYSSRGPPPRCSSRRRDVGLSRILASSSSSLNV